MTWVIVGAIVLGGFLLSKLVERWKARSVVPPPIVPVVTPLPSLASVSDEVLEFELGQRMKRRAETEQLRKTVEAIRDLYIAQTTPIMSALPSDVKPHPAALLAETPPPKG